MKGRPRHADRILTAVFTQMMLEDSAGHGDRRGSETLTFNGAADTEDRAAVQPEEVLAGYRQQTSWVMTGLRVVHDYLAQA